MRKLIKNKKGFTLLECMIAMMILAVGLLAVAQLQYTVIRGIAYSKQATEASNFVYSKMEDLKGQPLTSLTSGSETKIGENGITYETTWTVTGTGNFRTIEVNVAFEGHTMTATTGKGGP